MNLDYIEENKIYTIQELSKILKKIGIPHNVYSIKKYEENGKIKIGRAKRSRRQMILGSEIKRFVIDYLKEAGAI